MTLAQGTKAIVLRQVLQLIAVIGFVGYLTMKHGPTPPTLIGMALLVAACGAYLWNSFQLLPKYSSPDFRVTQGGVREYSMVQLFAMNTLSGVGAILAGLGGLALCGGAWGVGLLCVPLGFAVMSIRPTVIVDLRNRVIEKYTVGAQFPLLRTVTKLDDYAGIGVVLVSMVGRTGSTEAQVWRLSLVSADRQRTVTLEEVGVGDERRWDELCKELNMQKIRGSEPAAV